MITNNYGCKIKSLLRFKFKREDNVLLRGITLQDNCIILKLSNGERIMIDYSFNGLDNLCATSYESTISLLEMLVDYRAERKLDTLSLTQLDTNSVNVYINAYRIPMIEEQELYRYFYTRINKAA